MITVDLSPCDPLSVFHSIYFMLFVINNSSLACMEPIFAFVLLAHPYIRLSYIYLILY